MYVRTPNAIERLEECRINPDFTDPIRNDLEFYIPQIISFYLSSECDDGYAEEIANFLKCCCKISNNFSHRIMFFLSTFNTSEN